MIIKKTNPVRYPELRGSIEAIRYPSFVEPKIDGELNWYRDGYLFNKSGKVREGGAAN